MGLFGQAKVLKLGKSFLSDTLPMELAISSKDLRLGIIAYKANLKPDAQAMVRAIHHDDPLLISYLINILTQFRTMHNYSTPVEFSMHKIM